MTPRIEIMMKFYINAICYINLKVGTQSAYLFGDRLSRFCSIQRKGLLMQRSNKIIQSPAFFNEIIHDNQSLMSNFLL